MAPNTQPQPLLTTVVGSYPQPDWLIDREGLMKETVPRVRVSDLWRVSAEFLRQAQDDATLLAIRDLERAGIDIITDGEVRRESYSNRFATALEGLDLERPGQVIRPNGNPLAVPRIVGPIRRTRPVQVEDVRFLRRNTDRRIKVTVPGPFTLAQQAQNEYYPDRESLAMDYAACVNQEVLDLFTAGADIVQLDEPWLRNNVEDARQFAVPVINKALEGATGTTALHLCFGYAAVVSGKPGAYSFLPELAEANMDQISIEAAQPKLDLSVLQKLSNKTIILGVLDLGDMNVETPEQLAARIRKALEYVGPEQLIVAPDCGMKYLTRDVAYGKLSAMTAAVATVREELS